MLNLIDDVFLNRTRATAQRSCNIEIKLEVSAKVSVRFILLI